MSHDLNPLLRPLHAPTGSSQYQSIARLLAVMTFALQHVVYVYGIWKRYISMRKIQQRRTTSYIDPSEVSNRLGIGNETKMTQRGRKGEAVTRHPLDGESTIVTDERGKRSMNMETLKGGNADAMVEMSLERHCMIMES